MKKQTGIGLTQQKQSVTLQDGKKQLVKSNLILKIESITTKKVTKEVFLEVSTWTQKSFDERKHQINTYLKDIISTVTDSDELYIFWPC
jgi:aspartate carbamoyltransferase catalytic subunit